MARADRNGNRRLRSSVQGRHYSLGYYCIFTDTTETEENYLIGLKNALPKELPPTRVKLPEILCLLFCWAALAGIWLLCKRLGLM